MSAAAFALPMGHQGQGLSPSPSPSLPPLPLYMLYQSWVSCCLAFILPTACPPGRPQPPRPPTDGSSPPLRGETWRDRPVPYLPWTCVVPGVWVWQPPRSKAHSEQDRSGGETLQVEIPHRPASRCSMEGLTLSRTGTFKCFGETKSRDAFGSPAFCAAVLLVF